MFGKFPEINRNNLQGVAFTMFKVFCEFLDSKDAILLGLSTMSWIEMVALDPSNQKGYVFEAVD